MINLQINEKKLENVVRQARERKIIIPTLAQQRNPELIPAEIKKGLKNTGLWEIDSANLFRITWKNEPRQEGGLFGGVNYLELPEELTGVKARIIGLVGKWFPTGAHKVGATFGCLVPGLITGQFDPSSRKAVWPSTGNYCRGGAYNSELLGCDFIAVLPEGMSQERFEWLSRMRGEVIKTPGSESNVKEIFDKCHELEETRDNIVIFNQFAEPGNHLWHYAVTGPAVEEVLTEVMGPGDRYSGVVLSSGSAGTLGCADYLKEVFPGSRLAVGEALQCPTLYNNGYGAHRIEGIGDKHVPWIHNLRNTDMVIALDDRYPVNLIRLFNEPAGREYLMEQGVSRETAGNLPLLGISGIANLLGAIKYARYHELTEDDIVMTVFTDSMELYQSRLGELKTQQGPYRREQAVLDYHRYLLDLKIDYVEELTHYDRKRIHNLKYYTWVEQQGKDIAELNAQWYDHHGYWGGIHEQVVEIDQLIEDFNRRTGLLAES